MVSRSRILARLNDDLCESITGRLGVVKLNYGFVAVSMTRAVFRSKLDLISRPVNRDDYMKVN